MQGASSSLTLDELWCSHSRLHKPGLRVTLHSVACRDLNQRVPTLLLVCILVSKKDPAVKLVFVLLHFLSKLLILWASLKRLVWIFWAFATPRQLFLPLCCRYPWMNCFVASNCTKFTLCASSNFHKSVWELLNKHLLAKGILASGLQTALTTYICSSLWETAFSMRDCLNPMVWLLFPHWVTISVANKEMQIGHLASNGFTLSSEICKAEEVHSGLFFLAKHFSNVSRG